MKLKTVIAGALALVFSPALAQSSGTPAPGLWQVETSMKAAFKTQKLGPERKCLGKEAGGDFDRFFTTPPVNPKQPPLSCKLSNVRSGPGASTWRSQCTGPRGRIEGSGSSSFTAASYAARQSFKMGVATLTLNTKATRLGSC